MYEDALNQFGSLPYAARFTPKQSLAQLHKETILTLLSKK
jgi:hypothetical protein